MFGLCAYTFSVAFLCRLVKAGCERRFMSDMRRSKAFHHSKQSLVDTDAIHTYTSVKEKTQHWIETQKKRYQGPTLQNKLTAPSST